MKLLASWFFAAAIAICGVGCNGAGDGMGIGDPDPVEGDPVGAPGDGTPGTTP